MTNILAVFETVDAWVMKNPRAACGAGWLIGLALGMFL